MISNEIMSQKHPLINRNIVETWPRADGSKVFLVEALALAGKAMFGDQWEEWDIYAVDWPKSPLQVAEEQAAVARLRPPAPPPSIASAASNSQMPPANTRETEQKLLDEMHRAWEGNQPRSKRLKEAAEWLAQNVRDGVIDSFARDCVGGETTKLAPSEWNYEPALQALFQTGGRPTSTKIARYFFLDRRGLDLALRTLKHVSALVSDSDMSSLSPYLQFAVNWAIANGFVSRDKQWTRDATAKGLEQDWDRDHPNDPMGKTMADRMAFVVRFHSAEAKSNGSGG